MFGISYGEFFLLIGATAALIGPKDLPFIARTAGRLAGRAIGYVQLARGQFDSIMQQTQARQVHKELQDTIAQLEAIRHEIRSITFMNPGPLTRRLVDDPNNTSVSSGDKLPEAPTEGDVQTTNFTKECSTTGSDLTNTHSQAIGYAKLAESPAIRSGSPQSSTEADRVDDESGIPTVLPVSAETAGLLPNRKDDIKGSDIVLEAMLEAEVARNAKEFFSQPQNQIKNE
ncbi:hypothetical protein BT93_G2037 [Corymbia citriodora subsp. variegata]|nr:hypothetical protein BT93_G2037 [Corymbia citriodora subsp. variegata]